MVESFKELRVWQESVALAKDIYALVEHLPDKERFGLRSQMTRAVVSVASNIAEGSRRRSTNDQRIDWICRGIVKLQQSLQNIPA